MHASHPHLWLGRILAGVILPLLMVGLLTARPQKGGDDEDPKAKPKKDVPKDDEDPKAKPKKGVPKDDDKPVKPVPKDDGTNPPAKTGDDEKIDMAAEAAKATQPAVKRLFSELTYPHDVLHHRTLGQVTAKPVSVYVGERPNTAKVAYQEMRIPGKPNSITTEAGTGELLEVRHFEMVAINKVNAFLTDGIQRSNLSKSDPNYLSDLDQQAAADRALSFALQIHDKNKAELKRTGAGWDDLRKTLMARLLEVLENELRALDRASATDPPLAGKAGLLAVRISETFPDSPRAQCSVAIWRLDQATKTPLGERDDEFIKGADRLRKLEKQFTTAQPEVFDALRDKLKRRSQDHLQEAKKLAGNPDDTYKAQRQVEMCELIDPTVEGLQDFKTQLNRNYRILVVGVRQLPEWMSPALAQTDADRWAIELVFESLIKPVPDVEVGQEYRAELAARKPKLIPMGREFEMLPNAVWATRDGDGDKINADTVKATIVQLQKHPNLPVSERVGMLKVPNVTDPLRFQLLMDRGYLEPLAAMSFKVLPTQIIDKKEQGILDPDFAKNPIGSGPYVYHGRRAEDGKEFAVFKTNRAYASRPGKSGTPKIQEIRFVVTPPDPTKDLSEEKLDLVLDVTTADIVRVRTAGLDSKVAEQTVQSRRIWMLAVNHRRPELGGEAGKNLRRAISYAIDRDEILKTFRAGPVNYHRVLNGPFPPDVWTTPTGAGSTKLFSKEYAQSTINKLPKKPDRELKLLFVEDPLSRKSCEAIQHQIRDNGLGLNIQLVPLTAVALHQAMMSDHDFDLAYVPYDYNEVYSLTGLFDVNAVGREERNFMGYAPDSHMAQWLSAIRGTRNFNEVKRVSHNVHSAFNETMPFIPLWQLDFHLLVSRKLELHPMKECLDPLTIFDEVESWRLNR